MAFCKICTCGTKTVFERRMGYPLNCPSCGRKMEDFTTYNENDPAVEIIMAGNKKAENTAADPVSNNGQPEAVADILQQNDPVYVLRLSNGTEIEIPAEGCIIGRTETGAEELAGFPSVSRQHLRVSPRRRIGVVVEDLSTYGTMLNGKRLVKNELTRAEAGSIITLTNVEAELILK